MDKRMNRYKEEVCWVECEICGNEIAMEYYDERGNVVSCDDCGAECSLKNNLAF